MASVIRLRRSANTGEVPDVNTISLGELLLNYSDGMLYLRDANNNLYAIQAHLVGYSFQSINVNGVTIVATQGNTLLTIYGSNSVSVIANAINNSLTFSSNVSDNLACTAVDIPSSANQASFLRNIIDVANDQANAAYAEANTANAVAQVAFTQANSAFAEANTANTVAQSASTQANSAFAQANAAYAMANVAANGSAVYANNVLVLADANSNYLNTTTVTVTAQANGSQANISFTAIPKKGLNLQNTAYTVALGDRSNIIYHNAASAVVWTMNTAANSGWTLGDELEFLGGATTTFNAAITPVTGVTLRLTNVATAQATVNVSANIRVICSMVELNVWACSRF